MDCFTGFFGAFPALTTFRVNQRYDSVTVNSGFPSWPCPAQEFIWTVAERVWVVITELFSRNPQTCPALRKIRAGRERLRIDSWKREVLERDWLEDFVFRRPAYQYSRSMDVEVDSADSDEHSFSLLTSLELFNTDAPLDGEDATICELSFCLPQVNRIQSIKLVGMLVDGGAGVELKLPHLDRLEAAEYIPFFDSGAVETELFHQPKELIMRSLYIPRIVSGLLGPPFEHPSRIERLHLSKITMYTHEPELAENFFTVLDTSNVRTLILDALDSSSTIWSELVRAVKPSSATAPPKFGRVTELTITNIAPLLVTCVCPTRESLPCMDCFTGFFGAFPALTTFRVHQRYESVYFKTQSWQWACIEPPQEIIWTVPERTWDVVTRLFSGSPEVCPALREIRAGRERIRIDSWKRAVLERDWLEDFVFRRLEYQYSRSMDVEADSADEHSVHTH
uniref:F-box domain-containing protein n=1 Tax=Mycena chlorophos TaxID=658473 RepID=A0ABQ0M2R4_MYCCL|nr:predicted protein [Mycena chlorophos]